MIKNFKKLFIKIKPYLLPYSVGIAIPIAVGILSAALTKNGMEVYGILKTPPLSPPAPIFPIVWSVLFILMGVSSTIVFINKHKNPTEAKKGLAYYAISLVLNFSWSIIFFNLQAAFFALIIITVLLLFIIKTIIEYRKVDQLAAYLQIPYAIWVCFAEYLNAGIWLLN